MSFQNVREVDGVRALASSAKALLCLFPDGVKRWVPLSQIDELSDVQQRGDEGLLTVSRWWAEKAGVD